MHAATPSTPPAVREGPQEPRTAAGGVLVPGGPETPQNGSQPRYVGPVYTRNPGQLRQAGDERLARVASGVHIPRLSWGIGKLDALTPRLAGQCFGVLIGRPGHGKTMIARWLARQACLAVMARASHAGVDLADWPEYVLYVTLEDGVDETALAITGCPHSYRDLEAGRVTVEEMAPWVAALVDWPLWVLGEGQTRIAQTMLYSQIRANAKSKRPQQDFLELSAEVVYDEIALVEELTGHRPYAVFVDYLQEMPVARPGQSMQEQVRANASGLRRLSTRLGCPVMVMSQAKREVDDRWHRGVFPIPEQGDSEYSAKAEQGADIVMSSAMPYRWPEQALGGEGLWRPGGKNSRDVYTANENLVVLLLGKQRDAKGRAMAHLYVSHVDGTIGLMAPNE